MISFQCPILARMMSLGVGNRAGRLTAAMAGMVVEMKGVYSRALTKSPLNSEADTSIAMLCKGTYGSRHRSRYKLSERMAITLDIIAS